MVLYPVLCALLEARHFLSTQLPLLACSKPVRAMAVQRSYSERQPVMQPAQLSFRMFVLQTWPHAPRRAGSPRGETGEQGEAQQSAWTEARRSCRSLLSSASVLPAQALVIVEHREAQGPTHTRIIHRSFRPLLFWVDLLHSHCH